MQQKTHNIFQGGRGFATKDCEEFFRFSNVEIARIPNSLLEITIIVNGKSEHM